VAGAVGGSGTSTIARALHARDCGVYRGGAVDILVCRTTLPCLGHVHEAIAQVPSAPLLAVVADMPVRMPPAVRARIHMVAPHVRGIVIVPYVVPWRELADPYEVAEGALSTPLESYPRYARGFATAMVRLAGAVTPLLMTPPLDAVAPVQARHERPSAVVEEASRVPAAAWPVAQ
jgi:hypothetical protein